MTRKNAVRNLRKENAVKNVLEGLKWLNILMKSFTFLKNHPPKVFTKSRIATTRKITAKTIFNALGCPPGFVGDGR